MAATALDELIEKCSNLDTPDLFSVIVNGLDLMRAHLAELDLEDCGVGRTMMAIRAGVTEALLRFAPDEFTAAVVCEIEGGMDA